MKIRRFASNPLITPDMDDRMGGNINGPSLIRAPDWLPERLGKYYLYFAHHQGQYIRLAYADDLAGPWRVYRPGTLQLSETSCHGHIASPDIHVDEANKRLMMYYHGPLLRGEAAEQDSLTQQYPFLGGQRSLVATSTDGIHFSSGAEVLGPSYFRVFKWKSYFYALAMPGIFLRSKDGLTNFEPGPTLFNRDMRHAALKLTGDTLHVFYSVVGDCPEHIVVSQIHLGPDWQSWRESPPLSVLLPETDCEGGDLPLEPSARGSIHQRVRQLRDPGTFLEDGRTYLLYAIAGESGLAAAEIIEM